MSKTIASLQSSAASFASRIEPDSQVNARLSKELDTRDESKRCPVRILQAMVEIFGDDMDDMPEVGSTGGNNPDIVEENKKDGKKGTTKVSWWKEFAMHWPIVSKEQKYLEQITNALSKNPDPALAGNLVSKPEGWLKGEQSNQRNRVNAAVSIVKMAGQLYAQENRLQEYPNVKFMYNMEKDKDGHVDFVRGKATYVLKALDEHGQFTGASAYLSAGEFLQLNVDRAIEKGSTWESLIYSRKRESEPADLSSNVKTEGTFDEYVSSIWHFVQNKNAYDRMVTYLAKEENASFRRAFHEVYLFMDKVATTPKVARLTAATLGEEDETEANETKAKVAANA